MGDINIPRNEQDALASIDADKLRVVIDHCIHDERPLALRAFRLHGCGLFVSTKMGAFERALEAYGKAKAARKRSETLFDASSAGRDLLDAVEQMQHRVAKQAEQGERFYIDDLITSPSSFGSRLAVRVGFRWRPAPTEPWTSSDITFFYDVDPLPDYTRPQPARMPSGAKQARERQERLQREWWHLKDQALFAVRDFFQDGGNGADIPKTFQVRPSAHTRGMNNFSTRFWMAQD